MTKEIEFKVIGLDIEKVKSRKAFVRSRRSAGASPVRVRLARSKREQEIRFHYSVTLQMEQEPFSLLTLQTDCLGDKAMPPFQLDDVVTLSLKVKE